MYAKPTPQAIAALKQAFPTADDASEIIQDLRHLIPARSRVALADRIPLWLRIEILAAVDRGCGVETIAQTLTARGIEVKRSALKQAITTWKKTKLSDQLQHELQQSTPSVTAVRSIKRAIADPPELPPAETKLTVRRGRPPKVLTSNGAKL